MWSILSKFLFFREGIWIMEHGPVQSPSSWLTFLIWNLQQPRELTSSIPLHGCWKQSSTRPKALGLARDTWLGASASLHILTKTCLSFVSLTQLIGFLKGLPTQPKWEAWMWHDLSVMTMRQWEISFSLWAIFRVTPSTRLLFFIFYVCRCMENSKYLKYRK